MSLELKFKITFESDYHISAGHGLGAGVDSALLRDADGAPVIRGTTLTGLLRDGLWRLLQTAPMRGRRNCMASGLSDSEAQKQRYCGQNHPNAGADLCPLCRLFGTPRNPKRWIVHSARPEAQARIATREEKPPRGAVVQRVRISPRARRAEARKLFSQEDGHGQTEFIFSITCPVSDDSTLDEAALWVAAARNVRQLGRSRNRGQGACLFSLVDVKGSNEKHADWQAALLDRFNEKWLNGGIPAPRDLARSPYTPPDLTGAGQKPLRVRLILRADEPLLIAERAEAGNMFDSRGVIPGTTVRGALAWLVAQCYDLDEDSPAYEPFVRTFLRGQVQFPCLYPAVYDNGNLYPVVPHPFDLFTCKTYPGKAPRGHGIWFATRNKPDKCPQCDSPLTNKGQFVQLFQPAWERDDDYVFAPRRSSEMHIQIDPRARRVSEGQLFGYVALDAGQYFVGDLICRDEAAWNQLQALTSLAPETPIPLEIGKANRRGYGQMTTWFQVIGDQDEAWRGLPLEKRNLTGTELTLTLLTDAIIADPWGRYATGFDAKWLERELKLTVEEIVYASASTRLVDGFNAHLGLPRWRDVALAAGSTVRLRLAEPAALANLQELEREGIGLRTTEGFGQIAFNHPIYQECQGITGAIKLKKAMELRLKYGDPLANFCQDWAKTLGGEAWKECSDPRFAAVARWLRTARDTLPAILAAELAGLGATSEAWRDEFIPDHGARTKYNGAQVRAYIN